MLTPKDVIPFLNHDDQWVVDHALRYFDHCHDPSPLTADDLWAVIDQRGETRRTRGIAADLADAPGTDRSFERLLRALTESRDDVFEMHYQRAARNVGFPWLVARRDELLHHPRLRGHVREHLARRLEVAELPTSELWNRLESHGRSQANAYAGAFNASESDALIEVLGRRGYEAGPRALEIIQDPTAADDWREIFAVRVLGEARYAPAVPALVEKFDIDADVLREVTQTALGQIGTPEVIDRLVAFYPGRRWDVRLYADEPIIRIKQPQSEAALLRLLEVEDEIDLRTNLLVGLAALGSLRGLEASRTLIAEEGDDVEVRLLSETLLAVATMTGIELPEAPAWRAAAEADIRRTEKFAPEAEEMLKSFRDNWLQSGIQDPNTAGSEEDSDDEWDHDDDEGLEVDSSMGPVPRFLGPDPNAPIEPIRRTTPKVGRNDPCPCGSGKKYKKCCMEK